MFTMILIVVVAGAALAFLQEGYAHKTQIQARENSLRALQIAETGISLAEVEIRGGTDPHADGVGVLTGTFANGVYHVDAQQDGKIWTLTADGTHRLSMRRIRTAFRVLDRGLFQYAVFSKDKMVIDSSVQTDAYDSRIGPWITQATNSDRMGPYADSDGHIGSNADIEIRSSVMIRGDAVPGPLGSTTLVGGSCDVMGDSQPRSSEFEVDPTPYDEFLAAYHNNDNASMILQGSDAHYNAADMTLYVDSSSKATLPEGTYFFRSLTFDGSSVLTVTGPVKIYVTGPVTFNSSVDANWPGQVDANWPGKPENLVIFAHPYALPPGQSVDASAQLRLWSSLEMAAAIYAPARFVWLDSSLQLYGAVVGGRVHIDSSVMVHYDKALSAYGPPGPLEIERLYWADLNLTPGR